MKINVNKILEKIKLDQVRAGNWLCRVTNARGDEA